MNWSIEARLGDLQIAGVYLAGLHVIRRNPVEGERRLVGRIDRLENDQIVLEEGFENIPSILADSVQL